MHIAVRCKYSLLRQLSNIRLSVLRKAEIGKGVYLHHTAKILVRQDGEGIRIANDVTIGCSPSDYSVGIWQKSRIIQRLPHAKIIIGEHTHIYGANICSSEEIRIGSDCQIACGVMIMDYNAHNTYGFPRGVALDKSSPVHIGDNVWIGVNSIILKGSEIGNNSIIAAGTVVKGTYPPYSLIVGNPAKLVKILDETKFRSL